MRLLLDITDKKAPFILELLKELPYVKTKKISAEKAQLFEDLKEAIDNVNKAKRGKLKLKKAKDLLNEL